MLDLRVVEPSCTISDKLSWCVVSPHELVQTTNINTSAFSREVMKEEDVRRLRANRVDIVNDLDVKYVLDYLIANFVFDPDDDERIRAEKTRQDRTSKLLNMLEKSPKGNAYSAFREALMDSYPHLVEKLDTTSTPMLTETVGHGIQATVGGKAEMMSFERHTEEHLGTPSQTASSGASSNLVMTQNAHKTSTYNRVDVSGKGHFVLMGGNNTTINIKAQSKKREQRRKGFLPWKKK